MQRLHFVPIGFLLSFLFFTIATTCYPGGSPQDPQSVGYSWMHNYISNLLNDHALNGQKSTSRPWALVAVILMGITTGYAAILFSERVTAGGFRLPIRYLGMIIAVFSLLAGIPAQHDLMVMLGLISTLILFFYLTVLLFKTRLTGFKIVAVAVMCLFYFVTYMYTTRSWLEWMPFMQKMVHMVKMSAILGLLYLSKPADFKDIS